MFRVLGLLMSTENARDTRNRWTAGRIATDLALIAVGVPWVISLLIENEPPGFCGNTPEMTSMVLGLMFLAARFGWKVLKAANDGFERWFESRTARNQTPADPDLEHPRPMTDP